jgi:NADPH-dependent ferric siderophore reductase
MRKGIYSVFTVKDKTFLTPHYIRIKFGMTEEQQEQFCNVQIGGHNKIFITEDIKRTYTTRAIDYDQKELWIDFVAHGDNGPASAWANNARQYDTLGIAMKEGNQSLFPEARNYLFAGDHTALPVIAAMLEKLPVGVTAKVILEVPGKEDELSLFSKANLKVQWLHNDRPHIDSALAERVLAAELYTGNQFVFVAAEQETAKTIKNYFKEKLTWPRESYSVVSYWSKGKSEDQSSAIRREERSR